jgi:hypothetical protein
MKNLTCFMMMQFHGENQGTIFEKVEEAVNRVNTAREYSVRLTRADLGRPLSISSIEDHLKKYIDNCDFAIAEISQLNPNVMFEMGYAIGISKPVIVMVQRNIVVPADFRGRLYLKYSIDELNIIPQILQGYIKSAIESHLAERQRSTYVVRAYASRIVSDMKDRTRKAVKIVEVLTTNLSSFLESGIGALVKERLVMHKDLKVRILTLDPESDFAAHRARQLKMSTRFFREQLRSSLERTSQSFFDFPDRCSIATFDEFPPQITFRVDDVVYSNIVSSNQQSRSNVLLRFNTSDDGVKESILSHFDTVWGRSTPFHRVYPAQQAKDEKHA